MTTDNLSNDAGTTAEDVAAQAAALKAAQAPLDLGGEAAKPAPAPADVKEDTAEGNVISYNPTGDVGLDMALEFVGKHGYGPDHPAMKAALGGDFSLLAAEMSAKDIKGSDRYLALGEKAFKDMSAKTEARQIADRKVVEDVAGGAEAWGEIRTWASANADPEEKTAIGAALARGGMDAKMAAVFLKDAYSKATVVSTEGTGKAVTSERQANTPSTNGTLDRKAYGVAVEALRRTFRSEDDFESSAAYKSLNDRRARHRE